MTQRIIKTIVLLLLVMGGNLQAQKKETRTLKTDSFSSIDVTLFAEIIYTQSSRCEVKIESMPEVLDRIKYGVKNQCLKLDSKGKKNSFRIREDEENNKIRVFISAPELNNIEMSGACSLKSKKINQEKISIDMSGASAIEIAALNIKKDIDLECSGAGKIEISEISCKKFNCDLAGACKMKSSIKAEDIAVEISGAGNAEINVNCTSLYVDAAGACGVTVSGTADKVNMDNSGVSRINTSALNSNI